MNILKNAFDRSAWILLVATVAAFSISGQHGFGLYAGALTLVIGYIKGRLVVLDFMEMRHAPPVWRRLLEGWLVLLTSVLLAIYFSDIGKL
ncbi:MAG: hypothetical protein CVU18_00215 [Betaproteobacteria bacterium HGW-Betaproteobacteria-12]|nr:MAG: hypothetical protein CVU18_00215 [Betaproteobacteria bacterium HGW-Betaproteobacteria-12]